jgi:hypothetical protein
LLKQHGTDLSLIAVLMKKTRIQIRRKYKYFEKKHPELIEKIFERANGKIE